LTDIREAIVPDCNSARDMRRIRNRVASLLQQALPKEEYAATLAVIIMSNQDFALIKTFLLSNSFWDDNLVANYAEVERIALI
jgi:hypothetical protein